MALRINRNRVREIRKVKGLSAVDLNILTGIPFSRIHYMERGTCTPTEDQKKAIAVALECSVEELFPKDLERNHKVSAQGS